MKSLRPYVFVCAIAVVVAGFASILFSVTAPSRYGAEMTLAVGDKNSVVSPELGDQAQAITNTVAQLLQSNVVAANAIKLSKVDTTPTALLNNLKAEQKPDAAALKVTYVGDSKPQAVRVLESVNTAFQLQFAKVGIDIKPVKTTATGGADTQQPLQIKVRVFDPPHAVEKKVSPRPVRNFAIAIFLGLLIAIFWTAFRESNTESSAAAKDKKPRPQDDA